MSSGRRYVVLFIVSAALALISLDNTIVNVALPQMQEALEASTSELQWVVDAYSVMFAGTLLLAGALGDRFGRRRALVIGLGIFGSASLAGGFATSVDMLIVCRAVMGIGGAFIMPSTLSILAQVFTDRRERAKAIGLWAAVAGAAIGLGPIVGGALLEQFSWSSVFWVNPPLVVVVLVAVLLFVPESKDPARPRLDPLGAILSTVGLIALVVTVVEVPDSGFTAVTMSAALIAIGALWGFVVWQHHCAHPLLPMSLFTDSVFRVALVSVGLVYFALMGVMFFLPQYLQLVQGFSPLASGFGVLPGALGLFAASLASPALALRLGAKSVVVAGLLIVSLGLLIAATLGVDSAYVHVGAALGLMGIGLGCVLPQATNGILASVPQQRSGLGSAVNDGIGELGGSFGVAILGSIVAVFYRSAIDTDIDAAGDAIASVPASVVEAVRESLASAQLVMAQISAADAQILREATGNAFVSGMGWAFIAGAVAALIGAAYAFRSFPAQLAPVSE
ncbi:MAG: MFS transporter [Candidatus Nanopelagicales bacterium]